ncbi:hypothetical protein GGR50DRAFT_278077 [Xylaria sp. CBS 124048]|nr:hypothetical protein GGR50DRAFT_278077 [Xylaria sp. CBS 124048]
MPPYNRKVVSGPHPQFSIREKSPIFSFAPKKEEAEAEDEDDAAADELNRQTRELMQKFKKERRKADAHLPQSQPKAEKEEDDDDGSDSDSDDVKSSLPEPSRAFKKLKSKDKKSKSIEDVYPGLFLPLTRKNILLMFTDREYRVDSISYPWRKNAVEVDKEQFGEMKRIIQNEISRHFIALSTSKCVGWAVITKFPWIDRSSDLFRAIRYQGFHHGAALKHDLLYEKLYTYLLGLWEDYPEVTEMTDVELVEFLGPRFDRDLAVNLWGRCIRVLDVDKTFAADAKKLGPWYMRQVFLNMSIKLLPVVVAEVPANPTLKWIKKSPTGWVANKSLREDASWFFDCLSIAPEVSDVEIDDFVFFPDNGFVEAPLGYHPKISKAAPAPVESKTISTPGSGGRRTSARVASATAFNTPNSAGRNSVSTPFANGSARTSERHASTSTPGKKLKAKRTTRFGPSRGSDRDGLFRG